MAGTQSVFERRRLNEEIEDAFIVASQAASNLETKIFIGKGSLMGDLQDFHNRFNFLVRLTSQLKEMETVKEGDPTDALKKKVVLWLGRKIPQNASSPEMEFAVKNGLNIFDEYYKHLMHQGIIALPTKKG
jgi:hypothetical protein